MLSFFWMLIEAWDEAKKRQNEEAKKARLLNHKIDYAYLEELVQKVNENPALQVRITHKDGSVLEINTTPRRKADTFGTLGTESGIMEVR